MTAFNQTLLILHFVGLSMGTSVSIGNIVMLNLIGEAAPAEKPVLARFPPAISKVGRVGPALLTIAVVYISRLGARIHKGDTAAAAQIQTVGKVTTLGALTAVVFAVLTFD